MAFLKRIFIFILHCCLILFLFLVARETWSAYNQEKLTDRFAREGIPVTVRVASESQEKKNWKDHFSSNKYFSFLYHNRTYTVHYILDSGWVGAGDPIHLLYLPALDAFKQPGNFVHRDPIFRKSPLVSWTVVSTFNYANQWFFMTVLLTIVIAILALSALARLTGIALLDTIAGAIAITAAFGGAIFVTWDLWMNYNYYNSLKAQTVSLTVPVITTDLYSYGHPQYSNDGFIAHYYSATIQYGSDSRKIAISESDYNHLKPRDGLTVLYNAKMDDMMSADYTVEKYKWFLPVTLWILAAFCSWNKWIKKKPA